MAFDENKSYQLRVRVTADERDQLDRLRAERNRGETLSDLVRESIALLIRPKVSDETPVLSSQLQAQVERLAELLKREPRQVEQSCIQGILDLIQRKCEVPLIVMETHLHMKYHGHGDKIDSLWYAPDEEPKVATTEVPK